MTLKAQRPSAQSFAYARWLAKIDALRSSTALVPVITALASGALLLAPTTAFAQSGGLGVGGTGAGTTDDFGNGTPGSVGRDTAPNNRDPGAGGGGGGPAAAGGAGAPGGAAGGAAGQNGGFFPIPTGGGDGGPGGGTANGGGGGGGGNYVIHVVSGVPFATGGPIYGYGGGNGGFRGGGGGAGGNNLVLPIGSPVRVIVSGGDVRGGPGGNGGSGGPPQARGAPGTSGGEGGDGGNGFLLAPPSGAPGSFIELNATTIVTGGTGGSGGAVTHRGGRQGAGGDAGAAIRAIGWRIQNAGTLLGGNGGDGGGNAAGGAGIRGSDLTIINSGTISGGLFGDRQTRASAIFLTGGTNSLTLNGGQIIGNIVINGNGSLDLISSFDQTLTNAISGNGSVTLSGSGKITLGGVNTFTGPLTVSNTTVTLNTPVAGDVTVAQGGTLVLGVNNAVGGKIITTGSVLSYLDGVTNNRPLTIGSDTTQLEVISGTGTQSGVIDEQGGPRGFEKIGAGTLILTATNTYSGVTTISGGALSVSRASNLGSGASTNGLVLNGGTLRVTGPTTLGTTTTITSNGGTIDTAGANASLAAGTIFNGQLVKTGTGTLQIRGSSTGTGGVALNQGQISIQNGDGLGTGVLSMATGTILAVTSQRQTVANDIVLGNGSGSLIAPSVDTVLAGRLSGGRLNVGSGTGNVILTNDANSYIITAIETGHGVVVGSGGRSGRLGTGEVINNGLLAFNRADAITVDNVISGSGTVRVQGAGSVTLSAVNTYTGATLVNAGTLLVTGSLSSDVTVGSGAAFGGTGTINGTVTINDRGGLAAGPGAGVLTMNDLVLNAGSVTTFDLGAAGVAGGPNNDLIRVTGNLTVNGGRINVARGAGFSRGQYTLFEFTNLTGTIGNLTLAPIDGGFVGNLAQGTGTVLLNVATTADMVWWNGATTSPAGSVIGGNGTWNRTDRNFSNAAGNVSAAWAGDGALAVFGGTSGTVTIAAGTRLSPAGLNFLTDGYVIAGANAISGLALGGPTGVDTGVGIGATITAVISGTGSLTKTGAGTLTLGGANTYQGPTTVLGGALLALSNTALGSGAAGVTVADGATLSLGIGTTITKALTLNGLGVGAAGALQVNSAARYDGAITLGSASRIFGNGGVVNDITTNFALSLAGRLTVEGAITGSGSVTVEGLGGVVLSGANAYAGTTTINALASLTLSGSGTFGTGNVINNGSLLINRSSDGTIANAISGTGLLQVSAGGTTTTLTGANSYAGQTTIALGTLIAANNTALGTAAGGTVVQGAATLGLQGSIAITGEALTLNGNGVGGLGNLRNFAGNNSFTGPITLGASSLIASDAGLLALGGIALGSNSLTIAGSGNTAIRGAISGSGALTKQGAGTLTLSGDNTPFTGAINIRGGTLTIASAAGLGMPTSTSALTIDGGTLRVFGDNSTMRPVTIGASGGTINVASGIFEFGRTITFDGQLIKTGSGGLNLSGSNTGAGGVRLEEGAINVFNGSVFGTGTITMAAGTTLFAVSSGLTLNNAIVLGGGAGSNIDPFDNVDPMTLAGVLSGGQLNVVGGAGRLVLTGTNTYGATTVAAGNTLEIGNGGTTGTLGTGGVTLTAPSSALVFHRSNDLVVANVISGAGTLTKQGAGTLTLTGANTYTGETRVEAGTLALGASGVIAGPVTNSATFTNAGTVSGGVTNSGSLTSTGTINGGLINQTGGTASLAGAVNGAVQNSGTITLTGTTSGITTFAQATTGVFDLGGNSVAIGSLEGAGELRLGSGNLAVNTPASTDFSGVISGSGGLTKVGTGTLTLTGVNTFTGLTTVSGGTLAVSSTGGLAGAVLNAATLTNAGTITGTVTNSGTLASTGTLGGGLINQSGGTASLAGAVSGGVQNGGAITLTGATSGIGLFDQAAGGSFDLAGFDTALGGLAGTGSVMLGAARLTTGSGNASTVFAGIISGSGGLTKVGTGTLVLSGANTYTGGTTITGGVLQIGENGTTGAIIGPVVNNGALVISRSDAVTFASLVSGTGMLVQDGTGTTTLTAANTYTGGTLVNRGRLAGTTASLQGLIQINTGAALEFAQGAAGTFAGSLLAGTGLFEKTGAGLLTLTGNSNAFTGATSVRGGELRVNGGLAGSVVTVGAGATLSGTGVIGGLVAQSGSTIAPGTSPGVLGVAGNVTLQAGSTSVFEVSANGPSDLIRATGTATLGGTAALVNLGGTYGFGSQITLVQADGGTSGTFANVTGLAGFGIRYRPELVYVAGQARLRMAPNTLANIAGTAALTANQRAVVSRIDGAMTAGYNPDPLFAIYSLPAAQLPGAFDQLSGEAYATAAGVGIEQERFMREAVLGRLASVQQVARSAPDLGKGVQAWGQLYGGWGDGTSNGNAAAFAADRMGFVTGVDIGGASETGSWRAGAFGMRVQSDVTIAARGSRAEVNQAGGGAYAALAAGGFGLAVGGYLSAVDLRAFRDIALPGFGDSLVGTTEGKARQAFAELSYTIAAGDAQIRPFVAGSAGRLTLDALTERGGAAALAMRAQRYDTGTLTGGVDAMVPVGKVLRLGGALAARRHLGDRDPQAQLALAAAPQQAFAVQGAQLDRTALSARLDAMFTFEENLSITLGYSGLIGNTQTDHAARATIAVRF